ncbi:hypothetical protein D3C72_2584040 [compost metagenome]
MVNQFLALDRIALVENVVTDLARQPDVAFLGDLLQHFVQVVVLLGRRLGTEG